MKKLLLTSLFSILGLIAPRAQAFQQWFPTVTLNTPTAMQDTVSLVHVQYTIEMVCHLIPAGGESAAVILEVSPDWDFCFSMWGFCEHWTEVARCANKLDGTVLTGTSIESVHTSELKGIIPAGHFVRLRSVTTGSAPVITVLVSQETSY